MTTINADYILQQMRVLSAQARGEAPAKTDEVSSGFGDFLKNAISSVDGHQQNSETLKTKFELGDPDISLAQVMVAGQKADISFQGMIQVRNKVVKAYQEIMNMPI
jgi:flagellar hook-basal body complex protein FliE